MSDLKRQALTCEFGSLKDSSIRDRIVGIVFPDDLRGELLRKPDLTLQTAHDYCRTFEASECETFRFSMAGVTGQASANVQDVRRVKPKFNSQAASDPLCKFCGLSA